MNKIKNIKQNLMSFLKEEFLKTGLKKVTLGLSGGLDSAVVAVLRLVIPQKLKSKKFLGKLLRQI